MFRLIRGSAMDLHLVDDQCESLVMLGRAAGQKCFYASRNTHTSTLSNGGACSVK